MHSHGYDLLAQGFAVLAAAARQKEGQGATPNEGPDWIDPKASPLGKRRTLALARSGEVESTKMGRRVLIRRRPLEEYLDAHRRERANDGEDLFAAGSR